MVRSAAASPHSPTSTSTASPASRPASLIALNAPRSLEIRKAIENRLSRVSKELVCQSQLAASAHEEPATLWRHSVDPKGVARRRRAQSGSRRDNMLTRASPYSAFRPPPTRGPARQKNAVRVRCVI